MSAATISNFDFQNTRGGYNGKYDSFANNRFSGYGAQNTYSRFNNTNDSGPYLNTTHNSDLNGTFNYNLNQSRGDIYDRSYQKYGSLAGQQPYKSNTITPPYYENRSSSPKYPRAGMTMNDTGMGLYNSHFDKSNAPLYSGLQEPNSGISAVLKDSSDDFKLNI